MLCKRMQIKRAVLAGADWALFQRAYHQEKFIVYINMTTVNPAVFNIQDKNIEEKDGLYVRNIEKS